MSRYDQRGKHPLNPEVLASHLVREFPHLVGVGRMRWDDLLALSEYCLAYAMADGWDFVEEQDALDS